MQNNQIKKRLLLLLKAGAAVLVVLYLFRSGRLTKETFTRLLDMHNLPFIAIAAFAFIFSQFLASVRIVFLLRAVDFSISLPAGLQLTMIGNLFNVMIPGMVGGDFVKGYYLFKNEDTGKGRTSGIIIMDRFLGLAAILFIGGVSLTYLLVMGNSIMDDYHNELLMIFGVIAIVLLATVMFFFLGNRTGLRSSIKGMVPLFLRNGIFYHMAEGLGALAKNRRLLVTAFLISVSIQMVSLGGLLVLGNLLSETLPDRGLMLAVTSIVIVIGSIPVTPGNIGWTELVASFGWSAIGSDKGADIFIYWRVIILLMSLIIGLPCYLSAQNFKNFVRGQKNP